MTQTQKVDPKTLGRWTKLQHEKFLQGLEMYGKDWRKIQELIGTRNGAQIRSHAQKFFLRLKKQFDLDPTPEEINQNQPVPVETKTPSYHQESQEGNHYSYFVQKIVKESHQKEKFDFWESFVDQKSCDDLHEETGISKRKNSFMAWDAEEIEALSHVQPLKRVKTQ